MVIVSKQGVVFAQHLRNGHKYAQPFAENLEVYIPLYFRVCTLKKKKSSA